MTAVDSAANIKVEFPTPSPKFPLGGVALSMPVFINLWEPKQERFLFTRTWRPIYTGMPRNMPVFLQVGMLDGHNNALVTYTRQWNGIGGFRYLPSFPQLSRNETTWPHAT